jgi:hypothetical protein
MFFVYDRHESAELAQQLADLVTERESAARKRSASITALLELGPQLQSERADVEAERQSVATEAAREFGKRWKQVCDALAALRAEGRRFKRRAARDDSDAAALHGFCSSRRWRHRGAARGSRTGDGGSPSTTVVGVG